MDWYITTTDGSNRAVCYPCAMERLRAGETPLLLTPTDEIMRCSDCEMVFDRVAGVYVPRFDSPVNATSA